MSDPPSTRNYKYTSEAYEHLLAKEGLKKGEYDTVIKELNDVEISDVKLINHIKKQIKDYNFQFSFKDVSDLKIRLVAEARAKEEVPKEILSILRDPKLLGIIDEQFNRKIVREYEARKVIFLITNMRNVANLNKGSDNLIVNAVSGTGKDHVSESIFEILPLTEKEELVKTTPKVLSYTRNMSVDPIATWRKTALRLEDVSHNVVNDDSFKVFLTANPNKTNKGKTLIKQKVVEILIDGKPSIILTIANPDIKDENLRRLPMLFLDEGIDQTKEILKRQAEYAKKGISVDYDETISTALSHLKRVKVSIPYADKLTKIFENSAQNVIVRTAFPRFLDYIKSSAALYQFQRQLDQDNCIIANQEDYDNGALCLKRTTNNLLMIPLSKLDKALYDFFHLKQIDGLSIEELMDFEEIQKLGKSDRWIRYRLDFLTSKGFIKRISKHVDGSFKPVNQYSYKEVGDFKIPRFKELDRLRTTSNTSKASINSNTSNTSNTQGVNEVSEQFETFLNKHDSATIREKAINYIKSNPGCSAEKIKESLNISNEAIEDLIYMLKVLGLIYESKPDKWKVLE